VSFRSSKVLVTSIHTLFIKDLQGFQLHLSILFSSKSWRVSVSTKSWKFSVAYIHPSSFHQRSAGFSVASMHPPFIQKLVGFRLHPSMLFSSKTSTVSVSILPLFHLRAGGFSTSSIHPSYSSSTSPRVSTSLIHPLFSSTSWRVFHFNHPSSFSSKSNIWHPRSKKHLGGHFRIRRHL